MVIYTTILRTTYMTMNMTIAMTVVIVMIYMDMVINNMTYRIDIWIEMKIVIKSLDMILLPASIITRETYELQEINKDEKEKQTWMKRNKQEWQVKNK